MTRRGRILRVVLAWILAVGISSGPSAVRAEPTAEERSLAATLFTEGRRLLEEGRITEACPRLQESQRLDPSGGTLLNLAMCRKLEGRTATARALFTEALALARRDGRADRIEVCQRELAEGAARLATVVLFVTEEARVPGLEIRLNGVPVPELAWSTPIPVDPGVVRIDALAPGRVPRVALVEVADTRREVIALGALALTSPPPSPTGSPTAPAAAAPPPAEASRGPRPAAIVRVDVDGKLRGATCFLAPAVSLTPSFEIAAGVLLGPTLGMEADLRLLPWSGRARPFVEAAVPIFFDGSPYVGGRIALGVEVHVAGPISVSAASGAVFFPSAPEGFDKAIFLPSIGAMGRL